MRDVSILAAAFAATAMVAGAAFAAPVAIYTSDQVDLRLVASAPGPDGTVRGALLVELAPGWHTYWLDPGASGIPPHIDFTATEGLATAELMFPAPLRFGEGLARANGYDRPVAIGFALSPEPGADLETIAANLAIGVCQDICIPVQAELSVPVGDDDRTTAAVDAAFAALPESDARLGHIRTAALADGSDILIVTIDTALDAGATDLFVRGPAGWYFDEPAPPERDGDTLEFKVPVAGRPRAANGAPDSVDMVVTSEDGDFAAGSVPVVSDGAG